MMSLRARLVAGLLVLVAVGLVISDIAIYRGMQSFLVDRVDVQLAASRQPVAGRITDSFEDRFRGPGRGGPPPRTVIPSGTYAELCDSDGDSVQLPGYLEPSDSPPDIPDALRSPSTETYTTVSAVEGGRDYRVLSTPVEGGGALIVALPLDDVNSTLGRVAGIEVLATVLVLGLLGMLALYVVRVGLRPLVEIEHTAGAIAAGDLSQRVKRADDGTEVGRLGLALNAMLGQIQHAFEEKEASEQRLRQFVGDASHELRTPLTSIRGYAELFRRGASQHPDDLETAMRRIEEEGARMGVLVDDLLLLARLDQGRPLERAPVDLVRIAADAVGDARAADPDRPVTLVGDDGGRDSITVEGDEVRLRQVTANLLANARQHTPPGTPVRVRVSEEDGRAVLEVADDGPGLQPDEAAHVFERFYRADPSRARASGGTGLGLSIVAAIAEAHGGTASVDSTPGQGATFRVELPTAG
jgi:two-component system OmpR family sensor kinase